MCNDSQTVPLASPVFGSHIRISPDRSAETNSAPGKKIRLRVHVKICVFGEYDGGSVSSL